MKFNNHALCTEDLKAILVAEKDVDANRKSTLIFQILSETYMILAIR